MQEKVANIHGYIFTPENSNHTFKDVIEVLIYLQFPAEIRDQVKPFIEHNFWKPIYYVSFDYRNQKVSIGTRPLQDQIKNSLPYTAYNNMYIQVDNYPEIVARAKLLGIPINDGRNYGRPTNRKNRLGDIMD